SGFGKAVRRLFLDARKVEIEYYRKTRIFPNMHTLVLKTDLYNEKPWLAVSFYHAFCRARDIAQQSMYDTDALTVSLPWIIDEVEETRRLFGRQRADRQAGLQQAAPGGMRPKPAARAEESLL